MNNKYFKFYTLGAVVCAAAVAILCAAFKKEMTAENLTVEAGSPAPEADAFLLNNGTEGFFANGASVIDTGKLGSRPVDLKVNGMSYKSSVTVIDTVPPEASALEIYFFKGNEVKPEDAVTDVKDATNVVYKFETTPDVNLPEWQDISVSLTDEAGNGTVVNSRGYALDVLPEVTIEAGTREEIGGTDFISNFIETPEFNLTIPEEAEGFSTAGDFTVELSSGEFSDESVLRVEDTTPPSATVNSYQIMYGETLTPDDFVSGIDDASNVTVSYKIQPNFSNGGGQSVELILEDDYGNKTEYTAEINIIKDETPPEISGAGALTVTKGGTVSYRRGVTVTDDLDLEPVLTIDSTRVNLNVPGKYTVTYTAADKSGNVSEVERTVTVLEITMEAVNQMADEILAEITNENMTAREKAYAIFMYVAQKVKYQSGNSSRNLAEGAYVCFTRGVGDCYVYNAGSQVLLTRAGGIEFQEIRRYQGKTEHYWLVVNTGDGWYHFDASANNDVTREERFMFTDTQAREYTERIGDGRRYYEYDPATVPEIAD